MGMPQEAFQVETNEAKLREFYNNLRSFSIAPPRLIIKFHETVKNVECMIAENLQDGLPQQSLPEEPEKRAYEFLCGMAEHFGIEVVILRRYLFLKHVLRSQMGSHCVFGLRRLEIELEENAFFVHLDRRNNIVMVSAVYQTPYTMVGDQRKWSGEIIEAGIKKATHHLAGGDADVQSRLIQRICREGWVWVPNWETHEGEPTKGEYVLRYKIKVTTPAQSHVVLIDEHAECSYYTVDAHDHPNTFHLAHVLGSSWLAPGSPVQPIVVPSSVPSATGQANHDEPENALPPVVEQMAQPMLKKVLLRNVLADDGLLSGRYVAVEDQLNPSWPTSTELDANHRSSHLDRIMAFYHISKMQAYFRELGLTALEEYRHLNPLHVILTAEDRAAFVSAERRLYLGKLSNQSGTVQRTHARNTRTIYHECVHAVTDALARLHRQDLDSSLNKRASQLFQAAAMDEGLADYFACSLVAQEGDTLAEYRRLINDADGNLCWGAEHRRSLVQGSMDLSIVNRHRRVAETARVADGDVLPEAVGNGEAAAETTLDSTEVVTFSQADVYEWCEHWSRYLWLLRHQLGAEVADVLIANSIFYLHRWSSFGMGVLALLTADRLLFNGRNHAIILDTAKVRIDEAQHESVAYFYENGGLARLAARLQDAKDTTSGFHVRHINEEMAHVPLAQHAAAPGVDDALFMMAFNVEVTENEENEASAQNGKYQSTLDLGELWTMPTTE